jgi:Zn-dependent peptidase ImmA (M78 family)
MNHPEFNSLLGGLYKNAHQKYNIQRVPKVLLRHDQENSKNILGKTAYYNPQDYTIVLYVSNRHPKDILLSFAHELIHHVQNERGDLQKGDANNPQYAQEDSHLRDMEKEAYLEGNLLLRDFEDNLKYK